MQIIALTNQKGGVGKTTSAMNIGAGLQFLDKRVLLIDLDPQAHLTDGLGLQVNERDKTIYDLLKGQATLRDVIRERDGLDVIPSTIDLSGADLELSGVVGREILLREALTGVKGYDYIFLDCPPSLGILTLNALTTAKEVYITLQTEYFALQGTGKLIETVDLVKKRFNKHLDITGVIATYYDQRKRLNREIAEQIQAYFKGKLFNTYIRDNVALAEAPSHGKTIYEYKPESRGAEDYMNLCKEIIERGKNGR